MWEKSFGLGCSAAVASPVSWCLDISCSIRSVPSNGKDGYRRIWREHYRQRGGDLVLSWPQTAVSIMPMVLETRRRYLADEGLIAAGMTGALCFILSLDPLTRGCYFTGRGRGGVSPLRAGGRGARHPRRCIPSGIYQVNT